MNREEIEQKLAEIIPNVDHFSVMGVGDYNFAVDPNQYIHDHQIEKLFQLGFVVSNFEMVYQRSGMRDHLHIWLHKIQDWEIQYKRREPLPTNKCPNCGKVPEYDWAISECEDFGWSQEATCSKCGEVFIEISEATSWRKKNDV